MIALFGPAGSGKSLQGQLLAEKYGWEWLSVGELLRSQKDVKIDKQLESGELVDDELVVKLMHDVMVRMNKSETEVILDGYPRNSDQAKWMAENGDMDMVKGAIVLEVDREELWKRIEERDRNDDTREAVERRWEIFEQNICSILPLLEAGNVKITTLDGVGKIDEVTARIEAVLREWGALDELAILASEEKDGEEKSYGE